MIIRIQASRPVLAGAALLMWLCLSATVAAQIQPPGNLGQSRGIVKLSQPTITSLSTETSTRSGRIAINGTDFGESGTVLIAGRVAWITTWTDTRIVAYVPEGAALGQATLRVLAAGQRSNRVGLLVTARLPAGRVRWAFEVDGDNLWFRPALAPDGTIYIHTNNERGGLVYALTPAGALLWVTKVNWFPYVPPAAGPDGSVYVGSINSITRLTAQGQTDWVFRDFNSPAIQAGPTVGPDGQVYGAYETGMGAVALDSNTGALQWASQGDPRFSDRSGTGTEMRFGPSRAGEPVDQMYFDMNNGGLYAFSLDGQQNWNVAVGSGSANVYEPVIGADGTIYTRRLFGNLISGIDPESGSILWDYDGGWPNQITDFDIGPDDTLYYTGGRRGDLEAFDPHAQRILWINSSLDFLDRPTLTPDGEQLVLSGNYDQFAFPGFIKGYKSRNGAELWSVDLPFDLGPPSFRAFGVHRPRISSDSTTAYVSTMTLAEWPLSLDKRSFLYAIDITTGKGK